MVFETMIGIGISMTRDYYIEYDKVNYEKLKETKPVVTCTMETTRVLPI